MAVGAVLAAVAALWVTLDADFLAHPGWLAVQKADFILGPVFVGLYWRRVRPESRFWPLLIAFGAVGAVYILQSSSNPWLFGFSLHWENVIYLGNLLLILTFPTGRLDGLAAKLILLAGVIAVVLPYTVVISLVPQLGPDGSISGCRALCPDNALAATSNLPLAADLTTYARAAAIAVDIATAGLLIWRMVTGTPPQRRALMIGAPIALLFISCHSAWHLLNIVDPDATALDSVIQWALAAARSLIWYGFLFALMAAQLFAGRALHRLVRQSLRRPSRPELETMLREPLGDPNLKLMFLDPKSETGAGPGAAGVALQPPEPGREVTTVERGDGRPTVAIIHDAQLDDDPELLRAAGAVALLAAENAELDAAWNDALDELRRSRLRTLAAGTAERLRIERDLHDSAQQRLTALRIRLTVAGEQLDSPDARAMLERLGDEVDETIKELRNVAHGQYPEVLAQAGVGAALAAVARRSAMPVRVRDTGLGRHSDAVESTVYFCCLEALQNAAKHAGPGASATVRLSEQEGRVSFSVEDDGVGFDPDAVERGGGLNNLADRLAAIGGTLRIDSVPGSGTRILGDLPA